MWGRIAEQWVNYKWTVLFDDMLSPRKDGGNYKQGPLFVRGWEAPFIAKNKRKCRNSSTGGVSNEEKGCLTHKQSTNPHWGGDKRKETVQKKKREIDTQRFKAGQGGWRMSVAFQSSSCSQTGLRNDNRCCRFTSIITTSPQEDLQTLPRVFQATSF